ncbi:MAG: lysylphosphatidylglycerol synthase domain-containing protein, partial [Tumebacillaceae bacterium]
MWKKIIRLVAIGLVIWFVVRAVQVLHPTDLRKSLLLLVSNPLWLLFAAVGYSVAVCCKALAWQTLLPRDVVRTRTLVGYLQIANLINHIAPIKAGELFRLWVLRGRHGQPLLASTAVVALTRVFDVIVLLGSSLLLAGSMLP